MQSLYDRNAFLVGRIVDGGRDDLEGVMDVDNVRLFAVHQLAQLAVGSLIPDGVGDRDQGVLALHLVVAGPIDNHLVATAAEQFGLLGKDLIFSAGQLVEIVN